MTTKTKKLIELARRAKGVEGSEKWPLRLGVRVNGLTKIVKKSAIGGYRTDGGPLLHHTPLDPMNPEACLRRAGFSIGQDEEYSWVGKNKLGVLLERDNGHIWSYLDYMEALLNLDDLSEFNEGEWSEAWARAMNPNCMGE